MGAEQAAGRGERGGALLIPRYAGSYHARAHNPRTRPDRVLCQDAAQRPRQPLLGAAGIRELARSNAVLQATCGTQQESGA